MVSAGRCHAPRRGAEGMAKGTRPVTPCPAPRGSAQLLHLSRPVWSPLGFQHVGLLVACSKSLEIRPELPPPCKHHLAVIPRGFQNQSINK